MDKHPPTFLQNTYYTLKKGGKFSMGYYGNAGNWNNNCCGVNNYDYGNNNNGSTFVLIVVLFILLIIVGATFISNGDDC